jgi:crotonobetainyl-CoA:carnitine CoA-transferase CaiB-like acyl-CoA transferase
MEGALDGLRVVDFAQYLAGPLTAMMLSDLGAEVIRVDPPGGPRWQHPANAILQRGKRSIVLDLTSSTDYQTAWRLIERADVVIEGFRPGVMERLGLGAQAALAANARLIYCSLPGFGSDDPRAHLPAWEGIVNAAAGHYLPRGSTPPNYRGIAGADLVYNALPLSSSFAAIVAGHSILAALIARERTGLGQRVEVPLFDAVFELTGFAAHTAPTPVQTAPLSPPHMGHYRCADGRWLHLCLIQDRHLQWFARTFMPQEWIDDGMANQDRLRTDSALQQRARDRFARLFQTRPALEWERLINEQSGAPASICATSVEWLRDDQHARAIEAVIELDDPEYGRTIQAGYPFRLSKTPPVTRGARHPLNADRAAVLAELAEDHRVPQAQFVERNANLQQALSGLHVVDLTQVLAGPTSARILAEYEAEVIKINSLEDRQLGAHFYTNKRQTLHTAQPQNIGWYGTALEVRGEGGCLCAKFHAWSA